MIIARYDTFMNNIWNVSLRVYVLLFICKQTFINVLHFLTELFLQVHELSFAFHINVFYVHVIPFTTESIKKQS